MIQIVKCLDIKCIDAYHLFWNVHELDGLMGA
jgi:hypothetical protein